MFRVVFATFLLFLFSLECHSQEKTKVAVSPFKGDFFSYTTPVFVALDVSMGKTYPGALSEKNGLAWNFLFPNQFNLGVGLDITNVQFFGGESFFFTGGKASLGYSLLYKMKEDPKDGAITGYLANFAVVGSGHALVRSGHLEQHSLDLLEALGYFIPYSLDISLMVENKWFWNGFGASLDVGVGYNIITKEPFFRAIIGFIMV